MFTGIVEEMGTVVSVEHRATDSRIVLDGPTVAAGTPVGASIAVDGV